MTKINMGIKEFVKKVLGVKLTKFQEEFLLEGNKIIHPDAIIKIKDGDDLA